MRNVFIFLGVTLLLFVSCSKSNTESTIDKYKRYLTNSSNRTWSLEALYINGVTQTLTPGQTLYTKTYKSDDTWIDSDGYTGTFSIQSTILLKEITNNPNPPNTTTDFKINAISETTLDLEYTYNSQVYRFVYGL